MVGSAISRALVHHGYNVVEPDKRVDLRNQKAVTDLMKTLEPDWVFLAAAKVGGIYANSTFPAEFIYDNLMIQTNVIHAAYIHAVTRLLFLGSSCIYPKGSPQPIKEEYLLSGYLEPTNAPYAVAKIAGITMAQSYNRQYNTNYLAVMPCNLYGPNDNFHLQNSHVIPALMRKTHEAKIANAECVEVWGSGTPLREFLHVDDLAESCVHLMEQETLSHTMYNIGAGTEISIHDLALLMKKIVGFEGDIKFNTNMPDGALRKVMDNSRMEALGLRPTIALEEGLRSTYAWFLEHAS